MNSKLRCLFLSFLFVTFNANAIEAESPESGCDGIMALVDKKQTKEALKEARWCVEALESSLQHSVTEHFKESVAGWKRVDLREESTMGMNSIIAKYSKGDESLTVTLLTVGDSGGLGSALSGIAKMGMMAQGKRFRVQRLPATINPEGNITVELEDGAFINIESPQYKAQEKALNALEPFLDAFPFADINDERN